MNMYVGMSETEEDIYTVARFVRLPCGRLDAFMKGLALVVYEIKKRDDAAEEPK